MDALSVPLNAHGRDCAAWAKTSPIVPPWANTATRWSGWAAAMRSIAPRTLAVNSGPGSPPGMTSQRSSSNMRTAIGSSSATRRRNSPPSQSPRYTSRRSGSTIGVSPRNSASADAVSLVRRRVVT